MSKYNEFVAGVKAANKGTNYSKTDLVNLACEMFNDSECGIPTYSKKGDTYEEKVIYPSKQLRSSLIAPILKGFGVDRAELQKLDEAQTSRAGGEALADFALLLIKEYVSANGLGRKLTLPMTNPDQAIIGISAVSVPEEKRATTMIVRGGDGAYTTTPTGKIVTTKAHEKIKVSSRVPAWLKTTENAK